MSEENRFAEFIARMAHDLRSPLTSVKGFSSTLLNRWDRFSDEQRLQLLDTIHKDAERMSRIVSEVVDLARAEVGRLQLRSAYVPVGELANKAFAHLRDIPGAERVSIDAADAVVWGDAARLEHVLFNLLENAVKFSDEGDITLKARRANGEVEISIIDHGTGVAEDRFDEIFAGPLLPGSSKSGGLGLYLSRQLVEAHGGSIDVTSEVGAGSTFTLRLPAEPPE